MFLHPDLDTFAILPWRPQQGKVARLICDVYDREGNFLCKEFPNHPSEGNFRSESDGL